MGARGKCSTLATSVRPARWRCCTPTHAAWTTTRNGKGCDKPYLFNHTALAKVFRAKLLAAISQAGLTLPARLPETWVVDCKCVGSGEKALVYLGRYLYRG